MLYNSNQKSTEPTTMADNWIKSVGGNLSFLGESDLGDHNAEIDSNGFKNITIVKKKKASDNKDNSVQAQSKKIFKILQMKLMDSGISF